MTQRFIEFVMMQAQHAALSRPATELQQIGQAEELDVARMFIDQLVMIQEKPATSLPTRAPSCGTRLVPGDGARRSRRREAGQLPRQ